MTSTMARVALSTRPLVSLLRSTAVSHFACNTLRILASHVTVPKSNYEYNFIGKGWNNYPVRLLMKASKKREDLLKEKDKIPDDYEIIYRAPLIKYVEVGQFVSYLSLIISGSVCAFTSYAGSDVYELPLQIFQTSKVSAEVTSWMQMSVLIGFFFCINFAFQRVALSYPFRIYKKNDAYILVKSSYLPFKVKQVAFAKGDIKKGGSVFFHFLWHDAVFQVAGKTTIILEEYFRTPQDFEDMF